MWHEPHRPDEDQTWCRDRDARTNSQKPSAQLNLLYAIIVELTFENFYWNGVLQHRHESWRIYVNLKGEIPLASTCARLWRGYECQGRAHQIQEPLFPWDAVGAHSIYHVFTWRKVGLERTAPGVQGAMFLSWKFSKVSLLLYLLCKITMEQLSLFLKRQQFNRRKHAAQQNLLVPHLNVHSRQGT